MNLTFDFVVLLLVQKLAVQKKNNKHLKPNGFTPIFESNFNQSC